MKKLILITATLISIISSKAQITYEHTYPGPNSLAFARPVIINMGGNDGYKYMYVDYQTNKLNLFNLDHTTFASITVPVTLTNSSEYRLGYVTRTLFDCDSTMFEYAVLAATWRNSFFIYREDGTLLFRQDSTLAPWCVGCYDLSYNVQAVYNTPQGAKLFLTKLDSTGSSKNIDVYGLCGSLPVNTHTVDVSQGEHFKVYPNPATMIINFEFAPPSNFEPLNLIVYNADGAELKRESIGLDNKYALDVSSLPGGVYFFSIFLNNRKFDSGKFIISR